MDGKPPLILSGGGKGGNPNSAVGTLEQTFQKLPINERNSDFVFGKLLTEDSVSPPTSAPEMENMLGLLKVHIQRGINLAVRDLRSSDPYVVVRMGHQKLKTRVVKKNLNPEWNEVLTLCVNDPNHPIKLAVYDKDVFSLDDKMGDAEIDVSPFVETARMNLEEHPSGTVMKRMQPNRQNYFSEESQIMWENGKVLQRMFLRLRNVECGEVELELEWVDVGSIPRKT
ncbi:hypothetical protein MLD38_000056 [Melastoma candidum]|uniref:Uncharacterized protein n=1 Tax=Melastoma candidum TaxID=119954 RepID=A0ACB9SHG2_9MYRT|nr:hypothetical protein MLD38_000056 [Melastoma candidum]